jgi:hypothetical protein
MEPLSPQGVLLLRKTVAALVTLAALALLFGAQHVRATQTDATVPDGYFPAQFTIKPAAGESAEPTPTF